jgi:histidinol dehydrogenase
VTLRRFDREQWLASGLAATRYDLGATVRQHELVREICARVQALGDAALFEYCLQFDGWAPAEGEPLAVEKDRLQEAWERMSAPDREALETAARRIEAFHRAQTFGEIRAAEGLRLLTRPVGRVGLYVPGGRGAYPSTVLMTAIPARVAGVREVVIASPPAADGQVAVAILAAAALAGVDRVYRMGGAQAIAALAYGTESVQGVDLIAGPGNVYVTLAKREVFGAVGLDGLAGPTEIMIVADAGAPAHYLAADLASQLEHDPMAWAVLVTDSDGLADAVEESFRSLLQDLDRADTIAAAHCCVVVVRSLDEAMELANEFAPEHLELVTEDSEQRLSQVENAGAVFLGPHTPVTLGDYVIGPNHTLPTGGSARFSSPLGVHTFLKRTSVAEVSAGAFAELEGAARRLAGLEGLSAHARALEVRLRDD